MSSVTLKITGMTCSHCELKVTHAIKGVAGVYGAAVSLQDGAAEVDFDERRADAARIVSAVEAAGYRAQVEPAA